MEPSTVGELEGKRESGKEEEDLTLPRRKEPVLSVLILTP
jgi:hypothetical protein